MTYSDDIINLVLNSVREGISVPQVAKMYKLSDAKRSKQSTDGLICIWIL